MTRPLAPSVRRPAALAALAAAAAFGFAATSAVLPAPAVLADDVDDAIAQLKELVKANEEGKAIAKITELETKMDGRITDALADVARTAKSDRVAKAAMKVAAQRKDDGLIRWLKTKLDDKKMAEDHPERYLAVLDSVGFYGDKTTLKPLEDVVKKYLPTNSNFSKAAIRAYGSVREKPVVEQLVKWLRETENTRAGQGGKNPSAQTRDNYEAAKGAVLKALEGLTLQDLGDASPWEKWWKENEKTFEFPDPNAPEIDFATLAEYTDRAYGFTLKKPTEGKFWQLAKCEIDGGRVSLTYRDDQNVLWARLNVLVWKGSGEVTSVETFAQYYEKLWTEKEFSDFSKKPSIEAKKIGGREFQMVSARGLGADSWKGWESCERRVYITRANPTLFLYFEAVIRNGAEDPLKAAFWNAIEGATFKGPAK
jgi:hypothetical protein